jgi:hypothetical protein
LRKEEKKRNVFLGFVLRKEKKKKIFLGVGKRKRNWGRRRKKLETIKEQRKEKNKGEKKRKETREE